jgi:hypothetical protein
MALQAAQKTYNLYWFSAQTIRIPKYILNKKNKIKNSIFRILMAAILIFCLVVIFTSITLLSG